MFAIVRRCIEASNVQFWFWGQDVQHYRRKLFLEYGFKRYPPPSDGFGSSAYVLDLGQGRFLCLWAFGMLIGEAGQPALFFKRGLIRPFATQTFLTVPDRYISYDDLERSRIGKSILRPLWISLIQQAHDELFRYESWVMQRMDPSYRPACFSLWKNPKFDYSSIQSRWRDWESLIYKCFRRGVAVIPS